MDALIDTLNVLVPVLFLVLLNGYFVACEFALVRSLGSKLRGTELKDKFGTRPALKLLDTLDESISTTQLGITVASLVLGWFGEKNLHRLFSESLHFWGVSMSETTSHAFSTIAALTLVTFMHVVLGELVAKSIALRYPETTLRIIAPTMIGFQKLFTPFVYLMNGSANMFLGLFGIKAELEGERVHSTGELAMLIAKSGEKGVLDKDEEEMLQGIFHFSETIAREVMTPRTDLVTIPVRSTFQETIQIISSSGFSRFPVIDGSIDKVIGVVLSRDLLPAVERYVGPSAKKFSIKDIMREPYFIPGTKSINELLKEFKQRKLHMAIVLDEHGGIDGAVTLEDLIEEIVGDIFDESDAVENDIFVDEGSGDIIVDGGVSVDDINEQFQLSIPDGEYDTIAGFVMSSLGRVPKQGEHIAISNTGLPILDNSDIEVSNDQAGSITANGDTITSAGTYSVFDEGNFNLLQPAAIFTVESVTGNRIDSIRIQQTPTAQDEPSE
jgi:CBS domain containing-hemolysin-like protein